MSLTSDDPATWAGLMAACHTENTSCYLSGSAPRRQSLEHTLMSVVSDKGVVTFLLLVGVLFPGCGEFKSERFYFLVHNVGEIERPLAQSLEAWVLQQAVTGLMLEGQLDQAEALCMQVEHEAHRYFTVERETNGVIKLLYIFRF